MMATRRMLIAVPFALWATVSVGCDRGSESARDVPSPPAVAPSPAADAQPASAPSIPAEKQRTPKFVITLTGTAKVGCLEPVTKVKGDVVITTFKVKNLSAQAIAGLKVEEFWRDKAGQLVGGTAERLRAPLMPGETATITLRTPKDPRMYRNQYRFLHARGSVEVVMLKSLDERVSS